MKKYYIIYTQDKKVKKAVLDENMYRNYKTNKNIKDIFEYSDEMLLEKAYAERVGGTSNKKKLLD